MIDPEHIVSIAEARSLLRIYPSTISDWKMKGKVAPVFSKQVNNGKPKQFFRIGDLLKARMMFYTLAVPEGCMTLESAGRMLGLHENTVRSMLLHGRIAGKKSYLGRRAKWFASVADIERLAAATPVAVAKSDEYHALSITHWRDDVALAARREKLERDGIRINLDKLFDEWKRTG